MAIFFMLFNVNPSLGHEPETLHFISSLQKYCNIFIRLHIVKKFVYMSSDLNVMIFVHVLDNFLRNKLNVSSDFNDDL